MDPAHERAMLAKAPRLLTLTDIREWLSAAAGHDPDHAALGWLLPRLLELLAEGAEVAVAGNEVALRRLAESGFPNAWPADEVAAVEEMCLWALDGLITRRGDDLDGFLCMISLGGLALDPFLARLDALSDADFAALCVANWWCGGWPDLPSSPFWPPGPDHARVRDWYLATETILRIDRAGQAGDAKAAALAEGLWHMQP